MNYMVTYLPDAERELTDIWLRAVNRTWVTQASSDLDRLLKSDPDGIGESRADGRRILFVTLLVALYRVQRDDCKVVITHSWEQF